MSDSHGPDDGEGDEQATANGADDPTGSGGSEGSPGSAEEIGSVGDEAAKLFGALSEWARDSSGLGEGLGGGLGASLSGFADHAAATVSEINAHVATGSAECTYCPICRTVHAVRQTSPEVKAHLAGAASSFLQAMVGLLATLPPPNTDREGPGVEQIDLDDEDDPV